MTDNGQALSAIEIEDDFEDTRDSPFFADIDLSTPVNTIGFSIPRPPCPSMDPMYAREIVEHLKKHIALNEPV